MKNNLLIASGLLAALMSVKPADSQAQGWKKSNFIPYSEVGLGLGTSSYYGELSGYRKPLRSTFQMMRWNAGGMYTRHFTPHFAARASFTWARISGDDYTYNRKDLQSGAVQYVRNLHFRNDLKEFAVTGMYKFIGDGRNPNLRAKITPYIFAGLAIVAHSPEAKTPVGFEGDTKQHWVKLQPLNTEGQGQPGYAKAYSLVTLAIPVGLGVRYKLNDRFDLAAEVGFRFTTSDYLDDVGGPYPTDPSVLKSDLARAMSDRRGELTAARKGGNRVAPLQQYLNSSDPNVLTTVINDPNYGTRGAKGALNDGYLITSLQVHYILNPKIKCPPIR